MKIIVALFLFSYLLIAYSEELKCNGQYEYAADFTTPCPINCANYKLWSLCDAPTLSIPSCQCIEGTVRDFGSGKCVYPENCPKQELVCNKENEHYSNATPCCGLSCEYQTPRFCPCPHPIVETPSCQCNTGFFRDNNGNCVKPEQCPK